MMLLFTVPVQLSVKTSIVQAVCNSQHISAITSVLLLDYRVYPTCFNRSVYSQCALCNKKLPKFQKAFCLFQQ